MSNNNIISVKNGSFIMTEVFELIFKNISWKPHCVVSFNMGWRITFTNILSTHVKTSRNYFHSDMYNSTNTVVL